MVCAARHAASDIESRVAVLDDGVRVVIERWSIATDADSEAVGVRALGFDAGTARGGFAIC